jgi:hypothetical protein
MWEAEIIRVFSLLAVVLDPASPPLRREKRGMNVFLLISDGSPTSVTSSELFCICNLVFQDFYFAFARFCMETFLMCVPTKVRVVQHEMETLFCLG